ncbi:MAG: HAMP domain-containing histidine kinase [Lachnospiraceae bacterium]|nr:HAMP domain-containing histidine kinase [Lachnospiraceae bacterium]
MKGMSIRLKITLWFTLVLLIVVFFTYLVVWSVNSQVIQKTIRDNLIRTVENHVDELEFYTTDGNIDSNQKTEYAIRFQDGYLEVDDDFLEEVNEVYTGLYSEDRTLIYGENPIPKATSEQEFADSLIQKIMADGTLYYIFDRKLTLNGLEGLWLRGIVSEYQGSIQMSAITRLSLILLPALVLLAVIGGYLLAGRLMRPIRKISDAASQISKGGDLKKRIVIGEGTDELHQLADRFNEMFERLEEAFETERQFTFDASHELRTPVSVIAAQCEYTLERTRSNEEYEEAMQTIQRQGRKMSRLINDMLDITRLENRADSYIQEAVDLTQLVTSVCADMALIQERGITLGWEVQENIIYKGNPVLLTRLLTNLVSNAYRYGKEQGHIQVTLRRKEKEIELAVSDDGIGIAIEEQQKIFRRFYQADQSRSNSGTGLGLSMVYEIAQIHGGEIDVESTLGQGSTFVFRLYE